MNQSAPSPEKQPFFQVTKFPRWDVGTHVTIHVPSPGLGEWTLIMAIYGVLFGLLGGSFVLAYSELTGGRLPLWEAFAVAAIPMSLIGAMHLAGGDRETGVIDIDWQRGSIRFAPAATRPTNVAFSDVEALELRADYDVRSMRSSLGTTENVYHAQLDVVSRGNRRALLVTDSREQHPEIATEKLAPFAEQLATALGVELHQGEPVERRHGFLKALAHAPGWMHVSFFALCALSVSWIGWRTPGGLNRLLASDPLKEMVQELGGHEFEIDDWRVGNENVGSVSGYSFEDRSLQDTELLSLSDALKSKPRFALKLGGTEITDAGLQTVAGNNGLVLLDLYGTRVTDNGVASLSGCHSLVELGLNRTAVSDAVLPHIARLPDLRVLRLWGTRISDRGIEHLLQMPGLRELYLNDTAISSDGLLRLRTELSETQVSGP